MTGRYKDRLARVLIDQLDPRYMPRQIVSVREDDCKDYTPGGYVVILECGHEIWCAVEVRYPFICAICLDDLINEVRQTAHFERSQPVTGDDEIAL